MKTWIVFLVFNSFSQVICEGLRGKYGDRCTRINDCDSDAKLSCIDDFCRCSLEEEIFDYVRDSCAVREGERCVPPKFNFGEFNPCVANSFCSDNRICVCASHSYPDGQGRCLRKKFYNDTCTTSRECDDLKYLSCVDGFCSCKRTSYDEYYQICRRRAGDGCMRAKDCIKNSECVDSKCVCVRNFTETSSKTCGLTYEQPCGGMSNPDAGTCSDVYFACVNGACRCKNPSYEVFDNKTESCLSLVGGLCHLFLTSKSSQPLRLKSCVKNAECVRRDDSPLSQCECKKGFVETVSGHCRLAFGAVCKVPGERDALECVEPLVCRNKRCECQNENDVYDSEEKTCKRIVGSICKKSTDCITNSTCEKSRCKCAVGYLPTFRGNCEQEQQALPQNQYSNIVPPEREQYRKYTY